MVKEPTLTIDESGDRLTEKEILLRRIFDGLTLLKIGKELGDEYCAKFNDRGYDASNSYLNEEEVSSRIAKIITDEQLQNLTEKYRDSLLKYWNFLGRYYTYNPSERKLSLESSWDKIKQEIHSVYERLDDPVYGILKAFITLKRDYTHQSECKYGPLLYKAEELAGKSCRKALDALQAIGLMKLHKGDVEVQIELIPLIIEVMSEMAAPREPTSPPKEPEIPSDLFDTIIGYDDVKDLFRKSLVIDEPLHILLVGPPASAKTMFLLELERLPRSFYVLGSAASKAGLAELLFKTQPQYLLIDELDKMKREDYGVLLSICETGAVVEAKYGKTRSIQLKTWVFAAANYDTEIPREVLSRFQTLKFPEYSWQQFIDTATGVLMKRMKLNEDLASCIAQKHACMHELESRDVRQAIRLAKLSKSKEEVDKWIRILKRYSNVGVA